MGTIAAAQEEFLCGASGRGEYAARESRCDS